MWAGLDEAVPGCVRENNPGRQLDLLLRDLGRETPTIVLHQLWLGKHEEKGFMGVCLVEQEREKNRCFL